MIPKYDRVSESGREGQRQLIITDSSISALPVGASFTAEVNYNDGATVEGTPVNRDTEIEYLAASGVTTGTASIFNLAQEDFVLFDGALIRVKFHTNTTAPFSINVNFTGAIPACDTIGNDKISYNANIWGSFVYSQTLNKWIAQGVVAPITFKLISIPTGAWVSSSDISGYTVKADLTISGVTVNDRADVAIDNNSIAIALTANMLPSAFTSSNTLTFYAKKVPTATITGNYILYKAV